MCFLVFPVVFPYVCFCVSTSHLETPETYPCCRAITFQACITVLLPRHYSHNSLSAPHNAMPMRASWIWSMNTIWTPTQSWIRSITLFDTQRHAYGLCANSHRDRVIIYYSHCGAGLIQPTAKYGTDRYRDTVQSRVTQAGSHILVEGA